MSLVWEGAKQSALEFAEIFPNRYYLEVQNHGIDHEQVNVDKMQKLSKELNLPLVAAFYAFPDFSYYLGKNHNGEKINDSFELCDYILDVAKVVSVPGDGFGAPGHIRFSYAIVYFIQL